MSHSGGLLRCLRHSPVAGSTLRAGPSAAALPRRGIDELWKGGYLDPSISAKQKEELAKSGDAWPACLLRLKSLEDLRNLWFVCLKEKNLLTGERWAAWQQGGEMKNPERLKKVKLTMKRILTVVTRREIHQQCVRAKNILSLQQRREELETSRFHLEEQKLLLQHKIERLGRDGGLSSAAWSKTLRRLEVSLEETEQELQPLRRETMRFLVPDWHYEAKYSDLPGRITWRKQHVPALENRFSKTRARWY